MLSTKRIRADELRRLLTYDPFTGEFRWKAKATKRTVVGRKTGCTSTDVYVRIHIRGVSYYAHRLAWLYAYGAWPKHHIDHINTDRADNRLHNLRDATSRINNQNVRTPRSHNMHGFLGVTYQPSSYQSKAWAARITVNRKKVHLGYYATGEEAHAAYLEAKRKLHEGNTL